MDTPPEGRLAAEDDGSFVIDRDVGEVTRQYESEKTEQVGYEVDHESSWLESVRIKLHFGLPVAPETGKNQQHSTHGRNNTQPGCQAGGGGVVSLHLHEFAQCDREASNGESEDDGRDAGSHPRQKGAFVGEVIAGAIRV